MEATAICECSPWDMAPDEPTVRFCADHHSYWRGTTRLTSVSKLLRTCWPLKPDFSQAPPEVLENARDRGVAVDSLFTSYLNGQLTMIPKGTRQDATELFFRLKKWFDGRKVDEVQTQVILADSDVAGTCDVIADGYIYDLKTTYEIEPMYHLQVAAYAALYFETFHQPCKGIGIIHLTKRYAVPKVIKIDMTEALQDWFLLRDTYRMALRRTGKNEIPF